LQFGRNLAHDGFLSIKTVHGQFAVPERDRGQRYRDTDVSIPTCVQLASLWNSNDIRVAAISGPAARMAKPPVRNSYQDQVNQNLTTADIGGMPGIRSKSKFSAQKVF
jgi:hypothetical protein